MLKFTFRHGYFYAHQKHNLRWLSGAPPESAKSITERLMGGPADRRDYRPWTRQESKRLWEAVSRQLPELKDGYVEERASTDSSSSSSSSSTTTTTATASMGAQSAIQWKQVSDHVKTRSKEECCNRWHRHMAPGIKWGRWSAEEDALLRAMVAVYGQQQWASIAKHMAGRTDLQCVFRWQMLEQADRLLTVASHAAAGHAGEGDEMDERARSMDMSSFITNDRKPKRYWSLEESQLVVLLQRHFGRKWKVINDGMFVVEPRSPSQVRIHYDMTIRARMERMNIKPSHLNDVQRWVDSIAREQSLDSMMDPLKFPDTMTSTWMMRLKKTLVHENRHFPWMKLASNLDPGSNLNSPETLALLWQFLRPIQKASPVLSQSHAIVVSK